VDVGPGLGTARDRGGDPGRPSTAAGWTARRRAGGVRAGRPAGAEPSSKLAGTKWVAERVAIEGLTALSDDQAYRAMDFLLEALDDIAGEVFASVAHLLNLDLDIVFVDTTYLLGRRPGRAG
jgi:hypothetical protein